MVKSKRFLALVLGIAFLLLAAGCQIQQSPSVDSTAGEKQTVEQTSQGSNEQSNKESVTITFFAAAPDDATKSYYENAIMRFEESNPLIKVEFTALPDSAAEINKKLNAAKLSGMYPDVFVAFLNMIATRGGAGEWEPLDSYLSNWDGKDDIYKSVLAMGNLNGKQVALGFYPLPNVLVYRTDFFEEAGLDPNKPPANWTEIKEYARKLVKRDESGQVVRAGFDVPATEPGVTILEAFMRQNGSKVVDEENNKPAFTDEASAEALDFLGSFYRENLSIPYNRGQSETIPFVNGNAAMSYLDLTVYTSMIKNHPEWKDVVKIAAVIQNKEKVAFCAQRFFTMSAESKYKNESWEFIKFMMSKEEFWKRYEEMGVSPVLQSLEQQFIDANPEVNQNLINYVQYGAGKPRITWIGAYNKYLEEAYEKVIAGNADAKTALSDAYTDLQKELEALGSD